MDKLNQSERPRDVREDMPTRIWKSNLERIKDYIKDAPKRPKWGRRDLVKPDVNMFIESLLNLYHEVTTAKAYYVVPSELHEDLEAARGKSVLLAAKDKSKPDWPIIVMALGKDGE